MVETYITRRALTAYLEKYAESRLESPEQFYPTSGLPGPEAEEKWEAWVQDLTRELEVAVADRLLEWVNARNAGLPLGVLESDGDNRRW